MLKENFNCKVTIGLCVKNSEATVEKAVKSIFYQDFPLKQVELFVVDGCSHDATLKIIHNWVEKSKRIKYLEFSENKGLGLARQMVVNNATGCYIIWVDADMILTNSYIRNLVNFMDEHPDVGIASGKYALHLGQGIAADLENIVYAVDSVFGDYSASKYGYLPGTEGSIFRTKAIRQIGGFDVRMNGAAEDTEVSFRMIDNGWKVVKTNEVFAESTRPSWSTLWSQYMWYGKGGHFISHKKRGAIHLWKMTPLVGLLAGFLRLPKAYLLVHKKEVFLLPFHYTYKRIAWFTGFLSAHFHGYGHFEDKK